MTEFLTTQEAAELLRWAPQSLHNAMTRGVFVRGVHYFKREGEIGIRFDKAALIAWVKEGNGEKKGQLRMAKGYPLGEGR
jgi:hypothetical protein